MSTAIRVCRRAPLHLIAWCLLLAPASPAFAQQQLAAIQGTITDQTGGVIPGVTVTVTNTDTRVVRTTTTNERGIYRVPSLDPGRYEVAAQLDGFRKGVRTDVVLSVGATLGINFTLEVLRQRLRVPPRPGAAFEEHLRDDQARLQAQRVRRERGRSGPPRPYLLLLRVRRPAPDWRLGRALHRGDRAAQELGAGEPAELPRGPVAAQVHAALVSDDRPSGSWQPGAGRERVGPAGWHPRRRHHFAGPRE